MLSLDQVERARAGPGAEDLDVAPMHREPEAHRLHDLGRVVDDKDLHSSAGSAGPRLGTRKRNVVPVGPVSTSMAPSCACAIAREIGRPSPVPVWSGKRCSLT